MHWRCMIYIYIYIYMYIKVIIIHKREREDDNDDVLKKFDKSVINDDDVKIYNIIIHLQNYTYII